MLNNQHNWTDEQIEKIEMVQKIIPKLEWLKKNIFFERDELPKMFEQYILKEIVTSRCSYGFKTETLAEMWSGFSLKQIGKAISVSLPMIQIYLSNYQKGRGYKIGFYHLDGIRDGKFIGHHCIVGRPNFLVEGICVSSETKKLIKSEILQFELVEENRDEFFRQFEKYYKNIVRELLKFEAESVKKKILNQDWFWIDSFFKRFQFLLEE